MLRNAWKQFRDCNYFLFELFIFLRLTATYSSLIAQRFLLQDKLCQVTYGQSGPFCVNIEKPQDTDAAESMQDTILAATAQYVNYIYILQCIPGFLWSLLIGSFLDKFPPGTMILLVSGVVADLINLTIYLVNTCMYSLDPRFLLLTATTDWFTGGQGGLLTSMYKYTISHSEESNRSLRFLLLDVAMVGGVAFGSFIAGQFLLLKNDHSVPQLRTYSWNFYLNIALDGAILLLLFIIYRMDANKDKHHSTEPTSIQEIEETGDGQVCDANNNNGNFDSIALNDALEEPRVSESSARKFFRTLLNFDNVRQTFLALFRAREGDTRLHLYTLLLILTFQVFVIFGIDDVLLPFAEKAYSWAPEQYATYSSLARIGSTLLMGVSTTILVKGFHVGDNPLMILSHLSSFFAYLSTGTFLNAWSYFIAIPIGCLNNFAIISIRSIVSKIIPADEVGKIFSLIASLESAIPIVASPFYANVFSWTISTLPGAIYQASAAIMLLSILVAIFNELYFQMPKKVHLDE